MELPSLRGWRAAMSRRFNSIRRNRAHWVSVSTPTLPVLPTVEMAVRWVEQGANYLHVVDLDGARLGEPRNFELVRRMAEETSAVVQYGGGVRSVEALEMVTSSAVRRLVIGTSALVDEPFLEMALDLLGTGLVVAVDAEEGYVK